MMVTRAVDLARSGEIPDGCGVGRLARHGDREVLRAGSPAGFSMADRTLRGKGRRVNV
jgi:hypothetical protein